MRECGMAMLWGEGLWCGHVDCQVCGADWDMQ